MSELWINWSEWIGIGLERDADHFLSPHGKEHGKTDPIRRVLVWSKNCPKLGNFWFNDQVH